MESDAIARLERVIEAGFGTLADLLRETNARLDETNARLDETNQRLNRHEQIFQRHGQILERHEQALGRLIGEVHALGDRIDNILIGPMGEQVRDHDQRIASLESRLEALESRRVP
ncbi:MAG: hypothetical protein HYY06_04375 [Deltaproteobacteria bacterium]|nr:hypothetical protein [Deltaproteobacteria bacterium]